MVKIPKNGCPKYVITWKTEHSDPWLIHFVADTPCDGKRMILQNGREEVCHISVSDMTHSYKYFAFDGSDPSQDPGVCHTPNCPKTFLAATTSITCIDANSSSLTLCNTSTPAGSLNLAGGSEVFWRMPAGASAHFQGASPCEQGGTIPASSPYCSTSENKVGDFRYSVSTNGAVEYHIRVTPRGQQNTR